MNFSFIKSPEKRRIVEQLEKQYGITDLPYLLLETGKEKIRGFSGSLSKDEIIKLAQIINIELIGMYLMRKEHDLRLSFDALHILKDQITTGVIDLTAEEYQKWIRGNDLERQASKGTCIIRYKSDFIGCGKSTGERVLNHIPKERRLKSALKTAH